MADESRPTSRRARREAEAHAQPDEPGGIAPSGGAASTDAGGGMKPKITAGLDYSGYISESQVAAAFAEIAPEPEPEAQQTMSRKERRRLERVENPMETWTAEDEAKHTGQVPSMTPEAIAHQEETARQKVAASQQEAITATGGGTTKVTRVSMRAARKAAAQAGGQAPQSGGQARSHAPQVGTRQQRPPAQNQAIPPNGARPVPLSTGEAAVPMSIPQLAGDVPTAGVGQPQPASSPAMGAGAMDFEALVAGGAGMSASQTAEPPPVSGAFQSPGTVQAPGIAPEYNVPQESGPYAPPGQMVVPGTGTLQSTSGVLRTIPGTGVIPRPMVEIHPAGGVRHFGWPQLLLLAAAAFALGVVIWNVAASGS